MTRAGGRQVGVGIVGAGNVLGRYLDGMSRFPHLAVRGCATRSAEHARAAATRYGIGCYDSVPELLAAPEVEVVLNITPPLAHAVTTSAIPPPPLAGGVRHAGHAVPAGSQHVRR